MALRLVRTLNVDARRQLSLSAMQSAGMEGGVQGRRRAPQEIRDLLRHVLLSGRSPDEGDPAAESYPSDDQLVDEFEARIESNHYAVSDLETFVPRVFRAHRGRGGRHRRYKPRPCRQCRPAVPSGCGTTRTASTWRIALLGSAGPLSWCVITSLRGHRISPAIWTPPRPPCVRLSTGPSAPGTCVASRTPRIAARWPARSPAPLWGRRATARDTRRPHRPRWGRLTLCGEKSTDPRGIGDLPVHWSQKSLLLLQ